MFTREKLLLACILFFALFWRFANYQNRWTLNQDQARDAVIALYAIETKQIPLVGPPSSAGPFSFGPVYYFVIIIFTLALPFLINGPWVGFTLLSVISVYLFYLVGKNSYDKSLGFILASVAAFASANVFNAPDMLNPMLISFATIAAFLSVRHAFLAGFFVGVALNFHLQALGLLFLPVFSLLINQENLRQKITYSLLAVAGLITSFTPLLYFDFLNSGVWIKSIFNYFLVGQNKFHDTHSFASEIIIFWPGFFGEVISGNPLFGYFLILIIFISVFISFKKKVKLTKFWIIIVLTFIAQMMVLKFYKGPRLPGYLIVYHPFIIFLVGWAVWVIWKLQKIIGIFILLIILSFSSWSDWKIINTSTQNSLLFQLREKIDKYSGGEKAVYSYEGSNTVSLPLFYLWLKEGKVGEGDKIGICKYSIVRGESLSDYIENCAGEEYLLTGLLGIKVFDLNSAAEKELKKTSKIDSKIIYDWIYDNYRNK